MSVAYLPSRSLFTQTQDHNLGLINQVLERAPRWLIKKLTSTYLTLGLADIGKSVGIPDVAEVRSTILSMVGTCQPVNFISSSPHVDRTRRNLCYNFGRRDCDFLRPSFKILQERDR
jgi:hypothetical protein